MMVRVVRTAATREYDALWVEITTPQGNLMIQEGHAPIATTLRADSPVIIKERSGAVQSMHALSGIVMADRAQVTIIFTQ